MDRHKLRIGLDGADLSLSTSCRTDGHKAYLHAVKSAFAGVLLAREQLALAEQNLKTLDDTERLQRLRVEKGDLSELELLRIQVQRFTFERDASDARQTLQAAKIALRAAAGATNLAPTGAVRPILQRVAARRPPGARKASADEA